MLFRSLIVFASVGIFLLFGALATKSGSAEDSLRAVRESRFPNERWQAAFELSKTLAAGKVRDPALFAKDLISAYEEMKTKDPKVSRYLVIAMGYLDSPEVVPSLLDALSRGESDAQDSETALYALAALGRSGDPRALPAVMARLDSGDPGFRKMAAYALGGMGSAEAVPALERATHDGGADVRWNAAVSLSRLGSSAGEDVLLQMIDRKEVERVEAVTPDQVETAMIQGTEALVSIRSTRAVASLRSVAEADPSLRVREAAIRALKSLE